MFFERSFFTFSFGININDFSNMILIIFVRFKSQYISFLLVTDKFFTVYKKVATKPFEFRCDRIYVFV